MALLERHVCDLGAIPLVPAKSRPVEAPWLLLPNEEAELKRVREAYVLEVRSRHGCGRVADALRILV